MLSKTYPHFYEKLKEDRLITDDLHTVLAALPTRKYHIISRESLYIHQMTHLLSTSAVRQLSSSLLNEAWRSYHCLVYFGIIVLSSEVDPTEVHIQVTISRYCYIEYSHEFLGSALV